ncbi:MAG: hypothetical protein ACJ75L_06570 [Gaiellaceae bacterium]
MWKRLFGKGGDEPSAAQEQSGEDPRGGVQSDEYRHAHPEDVVQEGDVAMGGPGGAPADDESVEARRDRDRPEEAG